MAITRRMQHQCRFCLEEDLQRNLISPCRCSGSGRYIHAKCAYNWYKHNPSKGLSCQVCQAELATRFSHKLEKHAFEGTLYWRWIQHPAVIVNLLHWGFYVVSVIIDVNSRKGLPYSNEVYLGFQAVYHAYVARMIYLCVIAVENRRMYWTYWYRTSRMAIPLAHIFFIAAIYYQKILGGLSADICLMYYLMEHTEILELMNRSAKIEFVSAIEEQQEEQPSSESPSSSASDHSRPD
jgi:hypothetical protein